MKELDVFRWRRKKAALISNVRRDFCEKINRRTNKKGLDNQNLRRKPFCVGHDLFLQVRREICDRFCLINCPDIRVVIVVNVSSGRSLESRPRGR